MLSPLFEHLKVGHRDKRNGIVLEDFSVPSASARRYVMLGIGGGVARQPYLNLETSV